MASGQMEQDPGPIGPNGLRPRPNRARTQTQSDQNGLGRGHKPRPNPAVDIALLKPAQSQVTILKNSIVGCLTVCCFGVC